MRSDLRLKNADKSTNIYSVIIFREFNSQIFCYQIRLTDTFRGCWLGYGPNDRGSTLGRGSEKLFFFTTASRPTLWPTHLLMQWVPEVNWGVKLTTHIQLALRLRMRGAVSPLPHSYLIKEDTNPYCGT
jgi:hypothetical protein